MRVPRYQQSVRVCSWKSMDFLHSMCLRLKRYHLVLQAMSILNRSLLQLGLRSLQGIYQLFPIAFQWLLWAILMVQFYRGHAVPIECVVPMLGSIVEYFSVLASKLKMMYVKTIWSRDLFSHYVPLTKLLRLVT